MASQSSVEHPDYSFQIESLESRVLLNGTDLGSGELVATEPVDESVGSEIRIYASGDTGQEKMTLHIDGAFAKNWRDIGAPSVYTYNASTKVTGADIKLFFTNDAWDPANNIDRNLTIEKIEIDGIVYETEDESVYSTGTWLPDDGVAPGYRKAETLHTNGYFQFADKVNPAPNPIGSEIKIYASGDMGQEKMTLQIGDAFVQNWRDIGAAAVYTFVADATVSADEVRVHFTNDDWDPSNNIDRNLNVDKIEIDGVVYETEDESVFSTGTWLPEDGVAPGYRKSETLHSVGYFQFAAKPIDPPTPTPAVISMAQLNQQVGEQSGSTTITVTRAGNVTEEVSVDYEIVGGTAKAGEDFVAKTGTVVFAAGVASQTIEVSIVDNKQEEVDEPFVVRLLNPVGANLGINSQTDVTIQDDDEAGALKLSANYYIYDEATGIATVTIQRINGSDGQVSIDYATNDITALAGSDYTTREGTLVFADGVTELAIDIPLLADAVDEDGEQFSFVLENPQGGVGLLSPRTATIEISDTPVVINPTPTDPETTVTTEILANVVGAVAIEWLPNGEMLIADFGGTLYTYKNGEVDYANPFIDIRDQVNGPRGITDIAVHPDFANNPYVYIGFAYDPPEVNEQPTDPMAGPDGLGNRASRLIRVTADASNGYLTAVEGSEVVLLGKNSTWDNFNAFVDSTVDLDEPEGGVNPDGTYVKDFLNADSQSHTIGAIRFASDGALFVSNGDGASYNSADPRAARVLDIDNLSGKILRIDPLTGEGLADNPFYDGDPNSNRSKVYQLGLRNPFRFSVDANDQVYVADVGWFTTEELNAGGPGANFGWPYYEGTEQTRQYKDLPEALAWYASNPNVTFAAVNLDHVTDQIDAIIAGDVIQNSNLPSQYDGLVLFNHLASGLVRGVEFDAAGNAINVRTLFEGQPFVTETTIGPDGELYFVGFGLGQIGRWTLNG